MKDLTILFLAKYAPQKIGEFTSEKLYDFLYAEYHEDIYKIIKQHFPNTISATDPEYLFSNSKFDFVFSLLNRMEFRNSEVFISAICEHLHLPYLGATPNIRSIAEDKHLAKIFAEHLKIATAEWFILNYNENFITTQVPFPVFIKPRYGASSKWISDSSICSNFNEANNQIKILQQNGLDVLIERYIKGENYTVGILNNFGNTFILPPIKEESDNKVITYEEKRKIIPGLKRTVCEDKVLAKKLQDLSKIYFQSLKPMDYARFDFIVDNNDINFIEFNLCCNLGRASAITIASKAIGITYESLIENVLFSSLYRNNLSQSVNLYKF